MVGTFVLWPNETREPRLVAHFPVRAGSAGVPVFDVKPAEETYILVCEAFHNVGVAGILGSDGEDFLLCVRKLRPNGAIGVRREPGGEFRDGRGGDVPCEAPRVDKSIHRW